MLDPVQKQRLLFFLPIKQREISYCPSWTPNSAFQQPDNGATRFARLRSGREFTPTACRLENGSGCRATTAITVELTLLTTPPLGDASTTEVKATYDCGLPSRRMILFSTVVLASQQNGDESSWMLNTLKVCSCGLRSGACFAVCTRRISNTSRSTIECGAVERTRDDEREG